MLQPAWQTIDLWLLVNVSYRTCLANYVCGSCFSSNDNTGHGHIETKSCPLS